MPKAIFELLDSIVYFPFLLTEREENPYFSLEIPEFDL
jgi:hypothetical protein